MIERKPFDMPRVAMYIWFFSPLIGGAEKQCKILSEELVKKGISVFIVTERLKDTEKFEVVNGVQVYRVSSLNWLRRLPDYIRGSFNLLYGILSGRASSAATPIPDCSRKACFANLSALKSLSKILTYRLPNYYFFISSLWLFYKKRNDFDILHIHESQEIACFGIKIARFLNKKIIIKETISGELLEFKQQFLSSLKKIARADCFIAVSDKILKDMVLLGIPKEKIRNIPNGVDMNKYMWKPVDSKEQSAVCITKINQLPNKGIDILLEAWRILVQEYNRPLKLQIFGRGNPDLFNRKAVDFKIQDYVHFAGIATNVRRSLLEASLFVLPSRREGLSNALLEAMSVGMPCVATDISGNQDLIQHGKNGLLVPAEDPRSLADAVVYMLDNPDKAKDMGADARRTMEEQYTISSVADKYIELYRELVKK
jgi:glycosyltransferase involved in cell wall biosynthesis